MTDKGKINAIAARLRAEELEKGGSRRLCVMHPNAQPASGQTIDRDRIRRRIMQLASGHSLDWLVEQETWHLGPLKTLETDTLMAVLRTVESAVECGPHYEPSFYRSVSR